MYTQRLSSWVRIQRQKELADILVKDLKDPLAFKYDITTPKKKKKNRQKSIISGR